LGPVQAGLERIGLVVRQQLIWDKRLFALSRQHYHWAHEPCLYATRAGGRVPWLGPRNQSTVWQAPSPKMVMAATGGPADASVDHPTQKPVLLFSRPIENHLQPGEAVYDPFAGSGTSVIAAELTGRVCYALELDPRAAI
jgi:DNA modification methylase